MPPLSNARHERFAQELAKGKSATEVGIRILLGDAPETFYVYGLIDPRDQRLFYIGKGKGHRYRQHVREARLGVGSNLMKRKRIRAILGAGLDPVAVCFESGVSEQDALVLERHLIRSVGFKVLTNALSGSVCREEVALAELRGFLGRMVPMHIWIKAAPRSFGEIRTVVKLRNALYGEAARLESVLRERRVRVFSG